MTTPTALSSVALEQRQKDAQDYHAAQERAAAEFAGTVARALAKARKVVPYERAAAVMQSAMPEVLSRGSSRAVADLIDKAARIVHEDHDRFSWEHCGMDECRALQAAYEVA
jgi:hypothetical protein